MELRKSVKLRIQRGKYGQSLSYTVTIPKEFVEALGWKPGEKLSIILDTDDKEIKIRQ